MTVNVPDEVSRERLIEALNQSDRHIRTLTSLIDQLLTRSPLDSRAACAYCNVYAGSIVIRGQTQYVPRHAEQCPYKIALSIFEPEPQQTEGAPG